MATGYTCDVPGCHVRADNWSGAGLLGGTLPPGWGQIQDRHKNGAMSPYRHICPGHMKAVEEFIAAGAERVMLWAPEPEPTPPPTRRERLQAAIGPPARKRKTPL